VTQEVRVRLNNDVALAVVDALVAVRRVAATVDGTVFQLVQLVLQRLADEITPQLRVFTSR
jgi:hypothetical protein